MVLSPWEKKAARFLINPARGSITGKNIRDLGSSFHPGPLVGPKFYFKGSKPSPNGSHPNSSIGSRFQGRRQAASQRVDAASMQHSTQEKQGL